MFNKQTTIFYLDTIILSFLIQNKCVRRNENVFSLNLTRKKTAINGIVKQIGSNSKVVFCVRDY